VNSDTPDGVADALRSYLNTIDRVVADVTDDEIDASLRSLTKHDRPAAAQGQVGHMTICTVDIRGYGSTDRTRPNYVTMRAGMYDAVKQAFAKSGIPWTDCFVQDVGDSILALVPATVPKGAFAGPLPAALVAALEAYNAGHPPKERVELRLALHAGEVTFDDYGVASAAVIDACRLLNAPRLREILAESSGNLAMICSNWFYTEVIKHRPEYAQETYRKITVDVKEFSDVGWVRTPGHELPVELPAARDDTSAVVPAGRAVPGPPALAPASPEFYEVVDALEGIPCMQGEYSRGLVTEQLRFAGTIRYFPMRRAHVTSILRTCCDFETGVWELVQVISNMEPPDSIPLKRLLSLLFGGSL
jgi:effector-associated domain 2 (EAD2)-containing protein